MTTPCPGCLGRLSPARVVCLACELVLPVAMRAELDRTAGRPLTHQPRAVAVAEALTWLRVRREGRYGGPPPDTNHPRLALYQENVMTTTPDAGPDAAIAFVQAAVLRTYLRASAAVSQPLRVDWTPAEDHWESATVLCFDGDRPLTEATALIELDDGGQQLQVELQHLRPHQPCHCNNPDAEHPLGDRRFCVVGAA